MTFEAEGDSLAVLIDGKVVAISEDPTPLAPGTVGLYAAAQGITFDDFSASPLQYQSAAATLPYNDDFERAAAASAGESWVSRSGHFALSEGAATAFLNGAGLASATLRGVSMADSSAKADVTVPVQGGSWAGTVLRWSGTSGYLARVLRNPNNASVLSAELVRMDNGVATVLASGGATGPGAITLEAIGDTLAVFLDDTFQFQAVDTQYAAGGAGIATNTLGAKLDNVLIAEA